MFSMMDIYINSNQNQLTKFTSSRRSTELKYILPQLSSAYDKAKFFAENFFKNSYLELKTLSLYLFFLLELI